MARFQSGECSCTSAGVSRTFRCMRSVSTSCARSPGMSPPPVSSCFSAVSFFASAVRVLPNASLHPTRYSRLPRLPRAGELKRYSDLSSRPATFDLTKRNPHVRLSTGPTEHSPHERAARVAKNGRLRSQSRSNQRTSRELAWLRLASANGGRRRDRIASVGRRDLGQRLRLARCRVSEQVCL